jgi:hypothetical protein
MKTSDFELPPDPKRVIEGLRDTGYEFNTAIADIVDNSIAASATRIDLRIDMDFRGNIRVSIADDGEGMDLPGLKKAMQYGAPARPNPASLGKYGLGLKTASTAFSKRLSVVSRNRPDTDPVMATWDLEHVGNSGKWNLLLGPPDDEALSHLEATAPGRPGTVVVWTKVDRLLKAYENPAGAHARNALKGKVASLREHLAMVYQRFLDPADNRPQHHVSMQVNGETVRAWNPFAEGLSELVGDQTIPVELGGGKEASFRVRAFILPR